MWRAKEDLDPWFDKNNVRDRWLKLALFETLCAWSEDPSGPNASLELAYPWFCYTGRYDDGPEDIPNFAPVAPSSPYPMMLHSDGSTRADRERIAKEIHNSKGTRDALAPLLAKLKHESPDEWERRMMRELRAQVKAYKRKLIASFNFGSNPQRFVHADWTALAFAGLSRAAIADSDLTRHYEGGENTVAKAVTRFAGEIGLTLPRL